MRRSQRGVTLMELMAAVALTGILAGLAGASYQRLIEKGRASGAVRDLWASALVARQRAAARNEVVRFVVEDVTLDGRVRTVARWEQLPCEDTWGGVCPSTACRTDTCRPGGGCTCSEVGPDIVLPPEVDARLAGESLHGVCFRPGTGRPLRSDSGIDCQDATPAPAPVNVRVALQGSAPTVLRLEGLTGLASLVDCAAASHEAEVCTEEP